MTLEVNNKNMNDSTGKIKLKKINIKDYELIKKYYMLRRPMTSDSVILNLYLWENCYQTKYYCSDKGLMFVAQDGGEYYTTPPMCREKDIEKCFFNIQDYFNNVLNRKLRMLLVDKTMLEVLNLPKDKYEITEDRTYFDYIYDAEKLRTLRGRKYHKKKNHMNSFMNQYEERYEFRFLNGSNRDEIINFLDKWRIEKEGAEERKYIDCEAVGVNYLLQHYDTLEYKVAGVYVDGNLEAFTIGSYYDREKTAYISVEKANAKIRGLYAYINRQFLIEAFPNAQFVNREDDMGVENLRKAKESYHPIFMAEKYNIYQK